VAARVRTSSGPAPAASRTAPERWFRSAGILPAFFFPAAAAQIRRRDSGATTARELAGVTNCGVIPRERLSRRGTPLRRDAAAVRGWRRFGLNCRWDSSSILAGWSQNDDAVFGRKCAWQRVRRGVRELASALWRVAQLTAAQGAPAGANCRFLAPSASSEKAAASRRTPHRSLRDRGRSVFGGASPLVLFRPDGWLKTTTTASKAPEPPN